MLSSRIKLTGSKIECMRKSFSTTAQIPADQMHSQGTWLLTFIESPLVDIRNTSLQDPPKHLSFLQQAPCCQASLHCDGSCGCHRDAPVPCGPTPISRGARWHPAAVVQLPNLQRHRTRWNGHLASPDTFRCQALSLSSCNLSTTRPQALGQREILAGLRSQTFSHKDIRQVPHTAFRSGKLNKPYSILVHPSEMEQDRTSRGMAHCKYVGENETVDKLQSFTARQRLKTSSFQFMRDSIESCNALRTTGNPDKGPSRSSGA